MIGMIGIIVQDSEIKNTTQILREIKPGEKYLVRFLNDPPFSRVVATEEIQQWVLFPNQKEANNWVAGSRQQKMELPPETPKPPKPEGANGSGKKAEPTDEPSGSEPENPEDKTDEPVIEPAKPVVPSAVSIPGGRGYDSIPGGVGHGDKSSKEKDKEENQ